MARLPPPEIQHLQSSNQEAAGTFRAAAVAGNVLTGTAVAVLTDSGNLDFLSKPDTLAHIKVGFCKDIGYRIKGKGSGFQGRLQ